MSKRGLEYIKDDEMIQTKRSCIAKYKKVQAQQEVVRAIRYSQKKQYAKTWECEDHAIALCPNYAAAWFNKGNDISELKRSEEANKCYDRCITIVPECPNTLV